jgi:hypothetical protein
MPTDAKIEALLSEAENDPERIIQFKLERNGAQLYTNSKPFGKPGDPDWAFVMDDLVAEGIVTEVEKGLKWQLAPNKEI